MKISIKHVLLRRFLPVLLPIGMMGLSLSANANEFHHWVSHEDSVYENDSAWIPNSAPDGEEANALFGQQTNLKIGLTENHTLAEILFANKTNVTFESGESVAVGQRGDNKHFSVQRATIDDAFVRFHSQDADSADVTLRVEDTMNVDGDLHVVNGSSVSSHYLNLGTNRSIPTSAWVSGSDRGTWPSQISGNTLTVGGGPRTTMLVNDGAKANFHITYIGRDAPVNDQNLAVGEVNGVGDTGPSIWNSNAMVVGNNGKGRLVASQGGVVTSNSIVFGTGPNNEPENLGQGAGVVRGTASDGSPSTMNFDRMTVAVRGTGNVSVLEGGLLNTNDSNLALLTGTSADVELHSADPAVTSTWISEGNVGVGGNMEEAGGTANVRIREGSLADIRGEMKLWPGSIVQVEGGTLAANRIEAAPGGQLVITDGTLQMNEYEGTPLVQRGGTLSPGPGFGTTSILEQFSQRGGAKTFFEIGGTEAGVSHDRLAVDGNAIVDGTLQVDLTDGYVPASEDTFSVMLTNSLNGAYQNVSNGGRLAVEDGSGSFVVNYGWMSAFDPTQVILSDYMRTIFSDFNGDGILTAADIDLLQVGLKDAKFDLTNDEVVDAADRLYMVEEEFGTKMGDANLDRKVDFQDFLVMSEAFGTEGGWAQGDFDGNGTIDFPDFLTLSANFGESGTLAAASVPEPSSALIVAFGLIGLGGFRRKR